MADFVAVIRRAVDGLSDKSPSMRARVYEKARTAVRRQLEGMNPRPSDAAIEAQLAKLETAVESVEAEFVVPELSLEDLAIDEPVASPPEPQPEPEAAEWQPASPPAEPEAESEPAPAREPEQAAASDDEAHPEPAPEQPVAPPGDDRSGKSTVAPVPFGSYAMGRAPSFSTRAPVTPPAERPADGFVPSRYQTDFGTQKPAQPTVTQPLVPLSPARDDIEDSRADAGADEPVVAPLEAEPVAATSLPIEDVQAAPAGEPESASETSETLPEPEPVEPTELAAEPDAAQEEPVSAAPAMPAAGYGQPTGQPEPDIIFEDAPRQTPATPEAFFEDELRRQDATPTAGPAVAVGATAAAASTEPSAATSQQGAAEGWHDDTFGFDSAEEPLTERAAKPASRRSKPRIVGAGEPKRGRFGRGAIIAVVAVFLLAAAGFAAWTNQDQIVAMFSGDAQEETAEPVETGADAPEDVAALPEDEETPDPAAADGEKFTQRLLSDGTEVDEGPATSPEQPEPGEEGRSVTAQSQPSADPAPGEEAEITEGAIAESEAADPTQVAEAEAESEAAASEDGPAVGQTMFLYEERLGSLGPTAIEGSVVWSLVNESPGGDAQPEEAIRAEIDIPEKDLTALMTIRRNADASLPASHLIEIVFSLPATFEGGGIESVQRVAFKESEQDRGNELIAVPARITDDFFMVALNDYAEAVDTNTTLMRERNWIDIPVVYGNGRRALITLEKGSAGIEVFNQALAVWQRRLGGTAGQ